MPLYQMLPLLAIRYFKKHKKIHTQHYYVIINNMNTYLYIFNLKTTEPTSEFPLLPYEKKKTSRPYYQKSRNLLKQVLIKHDIPVENFHYLPNDAPNLKGSFTISLSHSEDIFVIALMETKKLGVDIQIYPPKNFHSFKNKYGIFQTIDEFLRHWTLVEAYCKATQSSLFKTLRSHIKPLLTSNNLYSFSTQTPYPIAIVASSPIQNVIISSEI